MSLPGSSKSNYHALTINENFFNYEEAAALLETSSSYS